MIERLKPGLVLLDIHLPEATGFEELDPGKFMRIHKSYIIALEKVTKLKKRFLSDHLVELSDDRRTTLKIGRSYLPLLKQKLDF